jgi:hypothetical protein
MNQTIMQSLTRSLGNLQFEAKKNSPHILFGLGIAGVVGGAILACRATLKLSDTLDEVESDISATKKVGEDASEDLEDTVRATTMVYAKGGLKIVTLYGPAILVGAAGIAALTGSHIQLTRRNTALMIAYTSLQQAYEEYRERVRERLGKEEELDLYLGAKDTILDKADGTDRLGKVVDPTGLSPYARFFDEYSTNWARDPETNRFFLHCQQHYANNILAARGHLFLNEVYDMIGFERTKQGSVVGWMKDGDGDGFVDFAMYDQYNAPFINGDEYSILLDFNVDGMIFQNLKEDC